MKDKLFGERNLKLKIKNEILAFFPLHAVEIQSTALVDKNINNWNAKLSWYNKKYQNSHFSNQSLSHRGQPCMKPINTS